MNFLRLRSQRGKHIVTHNGSFHLDDVMAVAIIAHVLDTKRIGYTIERTRDQDTIDSADFVVDVGGRYDPDHNRFDHHQPEGAGVRASTGIPYASAGLVWQTYGPQLCTDEVYKEIDKRVMQPIDANDSGVTLCQKAHDSGISTFTAHDVLYAYRATWNETSKQHDRGFEKAVAMMKEYLARSITSTTALLDGQARAQTLFRERKDTHIVVLDQRYPYVNIVEAFPEVLFVVYPGSGGIWRARAVPVDPESFTYRAYFPQTWAGKNDTALQQESGVSDAVFCHRARFLVGAKTQNGAYALAQQAIQQL